MDHKDVNQRVKYGYKAEERFAKEFVCRCGSEFLHERTFNTDFHCPSCGRLVDVKRTRSNKKVNISRQPFDTFPMDAYYIVLIDETGRWVGKQKQYIPAADIKGPFRPAHKGRYATSYYKVSLASFRAATNYVKRK